MCSIAATDVNSEPVRSFTLLPPRPGLSDARVRLLESALRLFGDRGYHAVSVRDLMASLGQQPGALYAHMQSKQDLLYELVCIGHEVHRDAVTAALLDAGREPADQVRAMTRAHVRIHLEYTALARVTTRELRALSEEQLATIVATRAESIQMFVDVIERGMRLGIFSVAEPVLAVQAIGSMGVRAAEWWTPDSDFTIDDVADTYADFGLKLVS